MARRIADSIAGKGFGRLAPSLDVINTQHTWKAAAVTAKIESGAHPRRESSRPNV